MNPASYVVVVNKETREAYTLDRNYRLLDEKIEVFHVNNVADVWHGYEVLTTPYWARKALADNFVAYWLY